MKRSAFVCIHIPTFTAFQIVLIPLDVSYLSLSRRNRHWYVDLYACVCKRACRDAYEERFPFTTSLYNCDRQRARVQNRPFVLGETC